jgi:hypothetical protein
MREDPSLFEKYKKKFKLGKRKRGKEQQTIVGHRWGNDRQKRETSEGGYFQRVEGVG